MQVEAGATVSRRIEERGRECSSGLKRICEENFLAHAANLHREVAQDRLGPVPLEVSPHWSLSSFVWKGSVGFLFSL